MERSRHPVIGFLTDFGFDGAAATCRGVMLSICPDAQVIDISHAVPKYRIAAGAFILEAALPYLPVGVHVGVVDPGVGTERRPIGLLAGRGDVLIGPDNGLLVGPAEALGGIREARELSNRELWLPVTSSTFHGRDIFAPTAAHLAAGSAPFAAVGPPVAPDDLVRLPAIGAQVDGERLRTEVVYVDSFGNLRLAGGPPELESLGWSVGRRMTVAIGETQEPIEVTLAESFGSVEHGGALLYLDSSNHLALALNQASLADRTAASVGARVLLSPADGSS